MSKILALADAYAEASSKEEGESQRWDSNLRYVAELQLEKNETRAALQAEVEMLEADLEAKADIAQRALAERDALQAEVEKLEEYKARHYVAITERDALRAESTEMALIGVRSVADVLALREKLAEVEKSNAQLLEALQPFVLANSSEEHMTLVVRTADITKARAAIAEVKP